MSATARKDSAGLKPIQIANLLRKIRFPVYPEKCRVIDEHGPVCKDGTPVYVTSVVVSSVMHAIASHMNIRTLTSDAGYKTLLDECGLSRGSKDTCSNAIKFLHYAYGILMWEQGGHIKGNSNSYWFNVPAVRQLIVNQGFQRLEGPHAQLLFGEQLEAREAVLAEDLCYGAKLHFDVSRPGETHKEAEVSRPDPKGESSSTERWVVQPQKVSRSDPKGESSVDDSNSISNSKSNSKSNNNHNSLSADIPALASADFDLGLPSAKGSPAMKSPSLLRSPLPHGSAQLCASLSPSRMRTVCADGDRPIVAMEDRDGSDRPSSLPPKLSVLISAVCMEHGGLKKITKRDADVLHLECGCQRATNPDIDKRLARADAIYGVAV